MKLMDVNITIDVRDGTLKVLYVGKYKDCIKFKPADDPHIFVVKMGDTLSLPLDD